MTGPMNQPNLTPSTECALSWRHRVTAAWACIRGHAVLINWDIEDTWVSLPGDRPALVRGNSFHG